MQTQREIRSKLWARGGALDNYRVIVTPPEHDSSNIFSTETKDSCERILTEIKRHVDDIGQASIVCDQVCKFCGELWDGMLAYDDNRPCCCQEMIDLFDDVFGEQETP